MKKSILSILTIVFILFVVGFSAFKSRMNPGTNTLTKVDNLSGVNWMSFEEAVEKSKTEKRKIFIDVYTDWCGWCKVMERKTFSQPKIAEYLNEKYYPVKLNAEQKADIEFKGHTFKYVSSGRRGYHELAAALLQNKLSYPTTVFLDENFDMLSPLPGFQEADLFEKVIKYYGGNHYKTTKWTDWERDFVSE